MACCSACEKGSPCTGGSCGSAIGAGASLDYSFNAGADAGAGIAADIFGIPVNVGVGNQAKAPSKPAKVSTPECPPCPPPKVIDALRICPKPGVKGYVMAAVGGVLVTGGAVVLYLKGKG